MEMDGYGHENGKRGVTADHLDTFEQIGTLLKGPVTITTDQKHIEARGRKFTSANQALRRLFALFANVRPARNFPTPTARRFDDVVVDMIVVRENTEDLYVGEERWVDEDTCEATKRISRAASSRIARVAFELALQRQQARGAAGSATVTAIHKANVCKITDGLFLHETRLVAAEHKGLVYEEALVDSLCAKMVIDPSAYDVLVAPNAWGDIVSDLTGGVVGSLGLLGSANIGAEHACFEASHGRAPDIANTGKANPASMILSAAMMLRHLGEVDAAASVEGALARALADGCVTPDLGGKMTTSEMAAAVCSRLQG